MPHILVIDDEKMLTDIIELALLEGGFDVTVINEASEAMESVDHDFDGLLCDIRMPKVPGQELIKAFLNHKILPIIAMTGFSDISTYQLRDLGTHIILHKPFTPEDLIAAVNRALTEGYLPLNGTTQAKVIDFSKNNAVQRIGRHGFFIARDHSPSLHSGILVNFTINLPSKAKIEGLATVIDSFKGHELINDGYTLEINTINLGESEFRSYLEANHVKSSLPLAFRRTV